MNDAQKKFHEQTINKILNEIKKHFILTYT